MKIALLARNPNLYSHRRLVEAAGERGHDIQIIDTLKVYVNIAARKPELRYKGEKLGRFDAVIPRIGASITFFGTSVVRQFEMMGVYTLNESVAISRARDKLRSFQLLSREGIGLPDTIFAHTTSQADDILKILGGAPVVIKLVEGTQGIGVVLGETHGAAKSMIQAFGGLKANILVQQFVEEARGRDIRCLVVGDKVVASIMRKGPPGEFRSNLHRGGSASAIEITDEERSTAIRATDILGLNVAGVDMLRSRDGPVVMEVNSSPGLEGIESATGEDIAGRIIRFIEKNAAPNLTRTRGRG